MSLRPYLHSSALLSLVLASFSDSLSVSTSSPTSQPHPFTPPPHTPYPHPSSSRLICSQIGFPSRKTASFPQECQQKSRTNSLTQTESYAYP